MDESTRAKMREVLLDTGLKAYIHMSEFHKRQVLAACVSNSDWDWIFEERVAEKLHGFILSGTLHDGASLLSAIQEAFIAYYDTPLEELFEDVQDELQEESNDNT